MFFTESGRAYVEKVYEIPEMGRASKGRSIANLLELRADEKIAATIRIQSKQSGRARTQLTKRGTKTSTSFSPPHRDRQEIEPFGLQQCPQRRHYRDQYRRGRLSDRRCANEWRQRDRPHHDRGHEFALSRRSIARPGPQHGRRLGHSASERRSRGGDRPCETRRCFWSRVKTVSANARRSIITERRNAAAKVSSQ